MDVVSLIETSPNTGSIFSMIYLSPSIMTSLPISSESGIYEIRSFSSCNAAIKVLASAISFSSVPSSAMMFSNSFIAKSIDSGYCKSLASFSTASSFVSPISRMSRKP